MGENGKMSWTKRRDRKTGGKPFGTSDKTGRNEERNDETRRHENETTSETQARTRNETDEQRANEATGNGQRGGGFNGARHKASGETG